MNHFLVIILLFYSHFTFGQSNCAIGFVPNSNEISYNDTEVDSILNASNYHAFFLGESHTDDFEPEFKYHFIKHLNSKYGIRDVFMEVGYSAAYFFNRYLQTGDTSLFRKNRLLYWRRGYKQFWVKLFAYNQTLPDSLKVVIHGIDFERTEIFGLLDIARTNNASTPHYLQKAFDDFHNLPTNNRFWDDKQSRLILQTIRDSFVKHTEDFTKLYERDFEIIKQALTNKAPVTTTVDPRNKIWFQNIKEIISRNKITKFIGFFGGAHTTYSNKTSLTNILKNVDFFTGRILNIGTIYTHSLNTIDPTKTKEYNYKEKDVVDSFYDNQCRATIIKSVNVPKTGFKTNSDYIIFAREHFID